MRNKKIIFFSVRRKIEVDVPQKMKKYIETNSEAKKKITQHRFFNGSFLHGTLFPENWQYCEMGKKFRFYYISTVYKP